MKIPKTLKIGGHIWTIEFPYIFTERLDRKGDSDATVKRMRISGEASNEPLSASAIVVVFIHEIIHAIDRQTGHNATSAYTIQKGMKS